MNRLGLADHRLICCVFFTIIIFFTDSIKELHYLSEREVKPAFVCGERCKELVGLTLINSNE